MNLQSWQISSKITVVSIEGDATYNEATEHEEFYPDEDALRKLVVDTFFELQS